MATMQGRSSINGTSNVCTWSPVQFNNVTSTLMPGGIRLYLDVYITSIDDRALRMWVRSFIALCRLETITMAIVDVATVLTVVTDVKLSTYQHKYGSILRLLRQYCPERDYSIETCDWWSPVQFNNVTSTQRRQAHIHSSTREALIGKKLS